MANANLESEQTVILNIPLAGVGGATLVSSAGALISAGDTDWLQSPMGTNAGSGTVSIGIIEVKLTASNAATQYDLALATNAITGTEIVAVLDGHNVTTAAGRMAQADHTGTLIKFAADAGVVANDLFRITFLYR
jgi:hypothetical protein